MTVLFYILYYDTSKKILPTAQPFVCLAHTLDVRLTKFYEEKDFFQHFGRQNIHYGK